MARILLLVAAGKTRSLLSTWLSNYHSVGVHSLEEPLDETCDLCILDGASLHRFADKLEARRDREQPGILPALLLTTQRDVWSRSPELWHYIDDAVVIPVSKRELQTRIEILVRARRVSLELKLRNEDLEAFIQAMSHDLRASVRAITMFTSALETKSRELGEDAARDLVRINWAAAEMSDLIESLLDFTRLGRGELRYRHIDLRSYIQTCVENLQAEIRSRGATVRVRAPSRAIHTDPTLLKIALTNLISNAIKFVPEGIQPEVTVSASIRKDTCRIQVNDNGVGIAWEDQQRIFMPFVRLHSEEEFPGVGLGLPSVRKVLELLGGRVGVRSEPGHGSTFWIEFPN
jgi:signal transduction histidine kinase